MSHTQHQAQQQPAPPPSPGVAPAGVPGGVHTAPTAPPVFSTPAPPADAPGPSQARAEAKAKALAALSDKLEACVAKLAHTLEADPLAELNAAVTELKAMADAPPA